MDNTLYQGDDILFGQIKSRITDYISNYLNITHDEAFRLQKQYLAEYGTSLSGMMAKHGTDPDEFLDYVHDVDLSDLKPCEKLKQAINNLPGQKYVFTNGSRKHAKNICSHLGIYHLFDGVYSIEDTGYIPKPKRQSYEGFNRKFDINPDNAVMFEDTARNLEIPKTMNMTTVLLNQNNTQTINPPAYIDHIISNLTDWLEIITRY